MSFWTDREASGNPVYPFEWSLVYADGSMFHRKENGRARTTRQAPERPVALRIFGRGGAFDIVAPPDTDSVVVRARVVRPMGDSRTGTVSHWRFGFMNYAGFVGAVLHPSGRIEKFP